MDMLPNIYNGEHEGLMVLQPKQEKVSSAKSFIEANTIDMSIEELRDEHIIPVFSATNEPLISHHQLIESVYNVAKNWFQSEEVLNPSIRVSHPIKGRVPDAKHKKASELEPWEQTLYYERMMFCIEIPTITEYINDNALTLTIGGVKSFSNDNLYGKRATSDQHFQLFIGFQNKVCCNLCISTDGIKEALTINNILHLQNCVEDLLRTYDPKKHLDTLRQLETVSITESEFAQLIGKCRLYKHLPENVKSEIVPLLFGDQQMGAVAKDFYADKDFCCTEQRSINLWHLYNLFTGVNKSTYIDQFVNRALNAQEIVMEVLNHKQHKYNSWYLQ
jgi:hypothetical protein